MFDALPEAAWTIKVGAGGTKARYRVGSVNEVIARLTKFAVLSKDRSKLSESQ
jgi:hypothetical protein